MTQNLKKVPNIAPALVSRIKFPEKFKGTIVEKWADYWKNLFIDYRQMLQDLRTDIQDNPRKAFVWTICLSGIYALAKNNPSEIDFKENLKRIGNEMILVSEGCQNPTSKEHLQFLETSYNQGVIHYVSLGIASVMYTSDLNDSCDLYKAHCSYLRPSYISLPSRLVDIGFMGKWWNIYMKTANYDVNF
ncbi:mitochondrial import inner membrane translocase subunit Tim29 [Galleria mellonella]|uniref:Mitochondrial import inner membrane translocase subunit Tim29 n=1 Tax=Galleria mellonella TaxID=7137 RepID=A0A6J1WGT5_GALME|nr:mitochondrial import inner membrane translocase subunit Tim29 [Galleria mellonella]